MMTRIFSGLLVFRLQLRDANEMLRQFLCQANLKLEKAGWTLRKTKFLSLSPQKLNLKSITFMVIGEDHNFSFHSMRERIVCVCVCVRERAR